MSEGVWVWYGEGFATDKQIPHPDEYGNLVDAKHFMYANRMAEEMRRSGALLTISEWFVKLHPAHYMELQLRWG